MLDKIRRRWLDIRLVHSKQSKPLLSQRLSWKADETRTALFYLLIPALFDILPHQFYEDLCTFHGAVTVVSLPYISKIALAEAEVMFKTLHINISTKWPEFISFLNMHDQIHLPLQVILTGSLAYSSGFPCESVMGIYQKCKLC